MRALPTGWPASDDPIIEVPRVYAIFDAAWPPAREDLPTGMAEVGSWSTARSLTGGLLPGQVRGATGMSIGSGQITIPQPEDTTLAPWRDPARTVPSGPMRCRLVATYGSPTDTTRHFTLGTFQAQVRSGSLASGEISVDLLEPTTLLRQPVAVPQVLDPTGRFAVDAVWIIDQLARSAGFFATPPPVSTCLASWPLVGSMTPERSVGSEGSAIADGYGSLDGLAAGRQVSVQSMLPIFPGETFYAALTISGTSYISVKVGAATMIDTVINPVARTIKTGTGTARTYSSAVDPNHPRRVQLRIQVTATQLIVSAKSTWDSAWSLTSVASISPGSDVSGTNVMALVNSGILLSAVQISRADEPGLWAAPTARLEPTGSTLNAVLLDPTRDAWATMRQVADSTLGAVWVTEAGELTYRGPESMRGVTSQRTDLMVRDRLADLPWSVDPDDAADRVEVLFTPPDVQTSTSGSLDVWAATDPTIIPHGQSRDVVATLDGVTARDLAPWQIAVTGTETTGSRWFAVQSNVDPLVPVSTGITVVTRSVSATSVTIRITNNSGVTIAMADVAGRPFLQLRANVVARAGEQQTISSGVPADVAMNPIALDVGRFVADPSALASMLEWLTAQTAEAKWSTSNASAWPDLRRQLGDVVVARDRETDLKTKALITGINLSGDASGIQQQLSLAVLDVTEYDVGLSLAGLTEQQVGQLVVANLGANATEQQAGQWLADRSI